MGKIAYSSKNFHIAYGFFLEIKGKVRNEGSKALGMYRNSFRREEKDALVIPDEIRDAINHFKAKD